ncbi:MAG: type II secretion system minor pseudopilin GspI [Piscirickettsiaceae bacterium]|nr:type II secretion system minor pseudopilin GspI [Piscirickettsiaceae bacterium]
MMKYKQCGLTLIEVMVSVAILAFALSALVKMTGQSINTLTYLEKKTFAQWVAINQVNEIEANLQWPNVGRNQGQEDMGGLTWYWQVKTSLTDSVDLRRLDVTVKQDRQNEEAVYQLTAFIHRP